MEMGADAVLVNTAIAVAGDPVAMAEGFKLGVQAGFMARQSGTGKQQWKAEASSPLTGFLRSV
jgi:thiazole synthase